MSTSTSVNVSWLGLLGVILVVLKLTGKIEVSWFWATAPFWIGFAILVAILALGGLGTGVVFGVAWLMDKHTARKRRKAALKRQADAEANRQVFRSML